MQKEKRDLIGAAGESVRTFLSLASPITVERLEIAVQGLGGAIESSEPLAEGEASIVRRVGGFLIRLDPEKPSLRKVFSIAHELGHLFLHMRFGQPGWNDVHDYVESYARSGYTEEEFEANEFAAGLLMPAGEFREVASTAQPKGVADHFGVSLDAAVNRGRWLGVYGWS